VILQIAKDAGKLNPEESDKLLQQFVSGNKGGDEESRTSYIEEEVKQNQEVENTLNYGKLCEIKNWALKDQTNIEKVQDLLDLTALTRKKISSSERKKLEAKGFPECAFYVYYETAVSKATSTRITLGSVMYPSPQ
jgi:hypothetical protein